MKTILGLCAVILLAAAPAYADGRHGGGGYRGGGNFGHGGGYGHHGGGRYFYYGGIPYFYPYSAFGFGDPYWYGGYSSIGSYPGYVSDSYFGTERPYERRIVDESAPGRGSQGGAHSLPGAVQRQLAKKGYYKGSIDGQFGPGSKSALRRYQRDNGLRSSGLIDEPTLKALGFGER